MKRILNLFILISLVIFSGCENLQEPQLPGSEVKIATAQEQIDAIKASLPKLKSTLNSLNSLTAETQERSAMAMTKASSNGNINNIKEYILALEERIEALEAYVNSDQSGDWTETTYATIEMYEETIGILAYVQCEIDALKGSLESAKEQICKDVTKGINEAFASMKTWVNEQLSGYYDIAATDAMFAKLQESLTAEDESVRKEIDTLRSDLAEQLDDMTADYKSAIKSAIEENNGILTAKLEKAIQDVNARIDSAIEEMDKRMKDIEDRLSKLEGTVEELLNRIQTMVYIPIYEDGRARVNFPNTDTSEGRLTLDFKISPKNAVTDIVKASRDSDAVTVQALYTESPIAIDLPVVECHADEKQGVFSVTVACDSLNMDFYNGEKNARAIMYISDGNNDKSSDYISLTPNITHVSNNQIWYTVTGKLQVDIEIGEGPKIVTHAYDEAKGCYVVNFDEPISTIRSSYFAGKSEVKTVSLPNSITTIEDSAFKGCNNLSQISLGNSVVSIGANTFRECALTRVDLPATLRTLGADAFDYSEIQSFTGKSVAADGLTIILEDRIKAVALGGIQDGRYSVPISVTSIEKDVFKNCTKINEVDIEDIQAWCNIDFEGQFSNPLHNGAILKSGDEEVSDITFPETMTKVKPYSFCGCTSLRSVTLPNKIQTVGIGAFMGCENLSVISMQSATAPKLDSNVFEGCENLKIYIPDQEDAVRSYLSCDWYDLYKHIVIWNIGDFPKTHRIEYTTTDNKPVQFSAANLHSNIYENGKGVITLTVPCTSFKGFDSGNERVVTCDLPESVSAIGNGAFEGCSSMTSFVIPEAVTAIRPSTFKGCSSLTEITIPQNISEIGESAFENCTSLATFILPSKVVTLNNRVFAGCVQLNNIIIHKDITSIGASAFAGCTGLTSLEFKSTTPPSLQATSFAACDNLQITIPTEESSLKAYLSSNWSDATLQKIPYLLDPANLPAGYWIEYTTRDGQPVSFKDSNIFYSYYLNGKGVALSRNQITSFGGFSSGAERVYTCNLPENVSAIGNNAFEGCSSMTSFVIPEAVTAIRPSTFKGCSSLTEITIPQNISEIGESAFENCTSLATFTLPSQVVTLNNRVFAGCVKLNNIIIHKDIISIGASAFAGCTGLTSLEFKSTTPPSLQATSFAACDNLQITIPTEESSLKAYLSSNWSDATLQKIPYLLDPANLPAGYWIEYTTRDGQPVSFKDSNIFYSYYLNGKGVALSRNQITSFGGFSSGAERVYTCNLPENVSAIGNNAFEGCSSMTSFVIPEAVTAIRPSTFKGCSSLTEITIPQNVSQIGSSAFVNCDNLSSIYFLSLTAPNISSDAIFGKTDMVIKIPETLDAIESYMFGRWPIDIIKRINVNLELIPSKYVLRYQTSNGTSIEISNAIYNKYDNDEGIAIIKTNGLSLSNASTLVSIDVPECVTSIGSHAFSNSKQLRVVKLPDTVTSIGSMAFLNCENLQSINIPKGVTALYDVFRGCISLTEIVLHDSILILGDQTFSGCTSLANIVLPSNLLSIGMGAFAGCTNITEIDIPETVTTIARHAFSGCTSLKRVKLSSQITSISNGLFNNCSSLTGVSLPNGIKDIGDDAFNHCTSLQNIVIPAGVTSIGEDAFRDCSALSGISLPSSVSYIGSCAFIYCSKITSVEIPDGVSSLYSSTFANCTQLKNVTIPDSVKFIDIACFSNTGIHTITIPKNVTAIRGLAFKDCPNLDYVYIKSIYPPTLPDDDSLFKNTSLKAIYVPSSSVDYYKTTAIWKNYASIIVGYDFD